MGLTGYLHIDSIDGESTRAGHEDDIDVHGVHWKIGQARTSVRSATRKRSRARVGSLTCFKTIDASSPYLALACLQGKRFAEMVLSVSRNTAETPHDYLVITMRDVVVSGFEMVNDGTDSDEQALSEELALSFEHVKYVYTVQADDGTTDDEHEIEFDIAGGV